MNRIFNEIYKKLRHVLIRFWERQFAPVNRVGPPCDFWLVCHSKDWQSTILTIESLRRFSLNPVNTIFLVCNEIDQPDWVPDGVTYLYEGNLPITKIALDLLKEMSDRGWVLQQLLKYSGIEYSERFVTIDCDTVLLKPHLFFTESESILRLAYEHSPQYRALEKSLGINGGRFFSFTCHMMCYKSHLLRELMTKIETVTGQNWAVYIASYAINFGMVINEQDLYARFILESGEKVKFEPWLNKTVRLTKIDTLDNLMLSFTDRNSVSFHNNESRKLYLGIMNKK